MVKIKVNIFLEEIFLPNIKKHFKIIDSEKDDYINFVGNYICQETLNYTNQIEVLEGFEHVILYEGTKILSQVFLIKNNEDENLKSISIGKTKIEFLEENENLLSNIITKSFYIKLNRFRRIGTLS
ncbi:MAG: hypothetical protein ACRCZ0_09830 [Cetobacterium sp.]